ncbi:hypothetical protein NJB95_07730 [Brucella intermedia]|nr:hypothetical protein [Brucella intermedia]MCO7736501.1 hypothetical protein [Brucella intermedia]WLF99175.1 hypothetical protein Q5698_15795 [Brucella intermedia]
MWQFLAAIDAYVKASSTEDGGLNQKEKTSFGVGERGGKVVGWWREV